MALDTVGHTGAVKLQTNMTATGNSQVTAALLANNTQHEFTTVGSGTGAILPTPTPSPPSEVSVFNNGSNTLLVYPPVGGTINGGSVNGAVSVASGTGATYWAAGLVTWYSTQTASAGGGGGTVNSGSSGQVAYYASSTTAVSGESFSSLLDAATGNAQGDVIYRGASTWAALTAGTNGQVLTSGGPSANPSWTTASGGGGSGTVNTGSLGQLAYYAGAGTAVSGEGLSNLIDSAAGNTQGSLLYRSSSAWTPLAPGTNGQILTTGGPAANPTWTTPSSGGSGTVNSGTLNQLAYYAGAGTTVSGASGTSLLDTLFGSTQGSTLYRGASAWSALAPPTPGSPAVPFALTSTGPSSNPSWTIYSPTPVRYVSLKALGLATSDPTNPASGTDVSTTLQAIANEAGVFNTICLDGGWYKGRVQLSSGCGIMGTGGKWDGTSGAAPKTGLIHPQTSLYAITNANWTSPVVTTNGLTSGTTIESTMFSQVVDQDIVIRDLCVHGNVGYTAGTSGYDPSGLVATFLLTPLGTGASASSSGDLRRCVVTLGGQALGDLIQPIKIRGSRNLRIENVSVYTAATDYVSTSYVDGLFVSNLYGFGLGSMAMTAAGITDHYGNRSGGSGITLEGTHRTVRIRDLSGTSNDDALALNAFDGAMSNTTTGTQLQAQFAAYWTAFGYYKGPITDVTVDGMNLYSTENMVRFLGGDAGSQIDRVTISNVEGLCWGNVIQMQSLGTNTGQPIGSVCLNNWSVQCNIDTTGYGTGNVFAMQLNARSVLLNNFTVKDLSGNQSALSFMALSGGTTSSLLANNLLVDGWQNILAMSGGTLSNCVIANSQHANKGSGNFSIYTTGGTPGTLAGAGNIGITQGGSTGWTNSIPFSSDVHIQYFKEYNWSGISDPGSPPGGLSWYSSAAGGPVTSRSTGIVTMQDGTFFKCGSCTALANSTAQTTLLGSPANSWGSLTIPSGALGAGQIIEIDFEAIVSGVTAPTLTLYFLFGGTTIITSGAQTMPSAATNQMGSLGPLKLLIRSVGSSGSMNGGGWIGASGSAFSTSTTGTGGGADTTGINFNLANAIDVQGTWSAASASNSIQIIGLSVRLKG